LCSIFYPKKDFLAVKTAVKVYHFSTKFRDELRAKSWDFKGPWNSHNERFMHIGATFGGGFR